MARNTILDGPPLTAPIQSDNQKMHTSWQNWFNRLTFLLGNGNHQTLSGAGAISLDARYVSLQSNSAGTYAVTLDVPTQAGVHMTIELTTYISGKNVTLALTNCIHGTASNTCTWNGANQTLTLKSLSNKWDIIAQGGVSLT